MPSAAAAAVVASAVVIAAAVIAAAAIAGKAGIGQDENQNDNQKPVVIVSETHGVNLLSCLSLPYYAGRGKG